MSGLSYVIKDSGYMIQVDEDLGNGIDGVSKWITTESGLPEASGNMAIALLGSCWLRLTELDEKGFVATYDARLLETLDRCTIDPSSYAETILNQLGVFTMTKAGNTVSGLTVPNSEMLARYAVMYAWAPGWLKFLRKDLRGFYLADLTHDKDITRSYLDTQDDSMRVLSLEAAIRDRQTAEYGNSPIEKANRAFFASSSLTRILLNEHLNRQK